MKSSVNGDGMPCWTGSKSKCCKERHKEIVVHDIFVRKRLYGVFINEWNEALVYHSGQIASYDLGHVAKISYIYDILIFGF